MALTDYEFIPLTEETDIKPFDCGDDDLNGFLFGTGDRRMYCSEEIALQNL